MDINNFKTQFSPTRPLLLVDADEVLLKFVERLDVFLADQGYTLTMTSFRLAGNIRHTATQEVAAPETVKNLIGNFFDTCVGDMAAVDHAAHCLSNLSELYQIAILSNVPAHCRQRRAKNLADLGMDYPVLANAGGKGPAVADLLSWSDNGVVFIDDLPPQHASVAQHAPDCHRIHTVADKNLAALIGRAEHAHVRIDNWPDIEKHLLHWTVSDA
ncbi:hypothetical protein GCM10017044_26400 [Kordiimonas sediminis]|uniref:HAD family hydrolase n=1 Tax=Kordiimonas sediminis TaxID=1735581 RepID=A0A919E8Y2_9PROT|nr:hypothetical protein [Kordiimonas sediminis]GHF29831.1 hypothetical protein GCM10017044_26400 [Kordiimonas sediminis]